VEVGSSRWGDTTTHAVLRELILQARELSRTRFSVLVAVRVFRLQREAWAGRRRVPFGSRSPHAGSLSALSASRGIRTMRTKQTGNAKADRKRSIAVYLPWQARQRHQLRARSHGDGDKTTGKYKVAPLAVLSPGPRLAGVPSKGDEMCVVRDLRIVPVDALTAKPERSEIRPAQNSFAHRPHGGEPVGRKRNERTIGRSGPFWSRAPLLPSVPSPVPSASMKVRTSP
jgi:hypothetical protein